MEKKQIPTAIEEISADWLTGALTKSGVLKGNTVQNLKYNIIGEGQGDPVILSPATARVASTHAKFRIRHQNSLTCAVDAGQTRPEADE